VTPEFSRIERVDTIGERARDILIEATEAERAALAERFGLIAVDALSAKLTLRREAAGITARGRVRATVRQGCVVTGEPVEARIDEPLALRFVVEAGDAAEEEIELGSGDLDTIAIEGGAIDLGEAVAETMALALDPFPRAPAAAKALRDAGVLSEKEARPVSPFAALGAQLGKGGPS
jgi:uncharacterized metal-binding protein YceD (DUF177 family)